MDIFLWGALENAVYATPVDSEVDLVAKIVCAVVDIQKIQVYLSKSTNS